MQSFVCPKEKKRKEKKKRTNEESLGSADRENIRVGNEHYPEIMK